MMLKRYAEDANYFDTTVHPAKSQAEIAEMLEDFGATNFIIQQGQARGKYAWLIRFEWQAASYRFVFVPLECKYPGNTKSFGGKRRNHLEQARYQMGRVAVYFVKAILTAAEMNPDALFGFLELPAVATQSGIPITAAQLGAEGLTRALPLPEIVDAEILYLTDGV